MSPLITIPPPPPSLVCPLLMFQQPATPLPPHSRCACGAELTLEMELDCGFCVDCQCEAAGLSNRGAL